ncbi:MAG TPA: peptide deformylase [Actinomycetota bacterium]|nr:peptide deformylase [Actinomycetota bacterium]
MAVRPVRTYPDPILKAIAPACDAVDDAVRAVAVDLLETMRFHPRCVGLSAPQIGVSARVICVDVTGHPKATACHGTLVIVNPEVVAEEGSELGREGCLSLPSITADVRRAARIFVKGLTVMGEAVGAETTGFEARAILHEVDHLDGILILDRVVSPAEIFPRRVR